MFNIAQKQCERIRDAHREDRVLFLVELPCRDRTQFIREPADPLLEFTLGRRVGLLLHHDHHLVCGQPVLKINGKDMKWEFTSRLDIPRLSQIENSCIPPDNHNFGTTNKYKIPLLQWYHYGSMLSLAERGLLPACWRSATMKRKVYALTNAAKISSTGGLFAKSPYAVDDEIVDRLAFLAYELDLEQFDGTADTVASASIQRVKQRAFTKRLNPGPLPSLAQHGDPQDARGPWEIHFCVATAGST